MRTHNNSPTRFRTKYSPLCHIRMKTQNPRKSSCSMSQRDPKNVSYCFTYSVPNATRRIGPSTSLMPRIPWKQSVQPRLSASTNNTLANLLLDFVGPLASIREDESTRQITTKGMVDAVQTALRFIGNASMNRDIRKNDIKELNTNLEKTTPCLWTPPLNSSVMVHKESKVNWNVRQKLQRGPVRDSLRFSWTPPLQQRKQLPIASRRPELSRES